MKNFTNTKNTKNAFSFANPKGSEKASIFDMTPFREGAKHIKNGYRFGLIIILALFIGSIFQSCKKDDEETLAPPSISTFEFGYNDSGEAYLGSDLHIEAEIVAEAKIDRIQVTIHPEGEHEYKTISDEHEWEVDTTYTKFNGLKNTTFHEHLEVPVEADTGHYHFHFIVIDMDGNTKEIERELHVEAPSDTEAPSITISSSPSNAQVFQNGETISISGTVTDNLAIGGLYVGLVRTNQNLENPDVIATNTITLLHMHDFDGAAEYNFSASIEVGVAADNNGEPTDLTGDLDGGPAWQSGEYYLLVKSPDAFGGGVAFSEKYFVNIEL